MKTVVTLGLALIILSGLVPAGSVPDFTLKKLDGTTFNLSGTVGRQVIIIDFWATWCSPCKKLLKKLQEIKDKYPDVLVLAVSVDDATSLAGVSQYVQGKAFTFTVLLDPDTNVSKMFNPGMKIPFTMVIDKKGEIAYTHTGYVPGDEVEILKKVESLRQ